MQFVDRVGDTVELETVRRESDRVYATVGVFWRVERICGKVRLGVKMELSFELVL